MEWRKDDFEVGVLDNFYLKSIIGFSYLQIVKKMHIGFKYIFRRLMYKQTCIPKKSVIHIVLRYPDNKCKERFNNTLINIYVLIIKYIRGTK